MARIAPTLVSYTQTASFNTSGASKTVTIPSFNTGDVVVVMAMNDASIAALTVSNATNLTFTQRYQNTSAGTTCSTVGATAIASGAGTSVVVTANEGGGGTGVWGFGVWVWRNSDGVGAIGEQHTSTKTKAITATDTHSAVCWSIADAAAGATGTPTPTATDIQINAQQGANYTATICDLVDQPLSGSTSYGTGAASAGPFSIGIIEVLGGTLAAGAGGNPIQPLLVSGDARRALGIHLLQGVPVIPPAATVVTPTTQAPLVVTPPTPVPPGGTQITKGRDGVVISTPLAPTVVTRPTPDVPGKTLSPPARDGITRATPLPPTVVTSPAPAPVPQIVTRSAVAGICVPGTGGPLWANTGTNDAGVGSVAWTNVANIPLAPFPKVGLATGQQSQWLVLGTYGFSIPSTAVIQGISVQLTHATNLTSNVTDTGVRLVKGGVIGSTDKSDPGVWPVGDGVVNYGGPSDLWGDTWLPADFNASNFGLALSVTNTGSGATARLDANSIAVYYCDPFGAPSVATAPGQLVTRPTDPVPGTFITRVGDPTATPFVSQFTPAPVFVSSPAPLPVPQTLIRRGSDGALQVGTITPQPVVISAVSVVPLPDVLIVKGGVTSVQVEASGQVDIVFGSTAIPTVSASGTSAIIFNATGVPTESASGTSSIIFNSTGAGTTPGGVSTFVSMRGANSAFVNVASATTDAPFTGGIIPAIKAGQCVNVLAVTFNADTAADTLVFNSKGAGAGTAISALFSNPINGSVVWPYTPVGWFTTNGGEGLSVTTTGASPTHVQIIFEYINA